MKARSVTANELVLYTDLEAIEEDLLQHHNHSGGPGMGAVLSPLAVAPHSVRADHFKPYPMTALIRPIVGFGYDTDPQVVPAPYLVEMFETTPGIFLGHGTPIFCSWVPSGSVVGGSVTMRLLILRHRAMSSGAIKVGGTVEVHRINSGGVYFRTVFQILEELQFTSTPVATEIGSISLNNITNDSLVFISLQRGPDGYSGTPFFVGLMAYYTEAIVPIGE